MFAWCGGSVLLRPAYLTQIGLFDERFFLYYEDTDLSWRGRHARLALRLRAAVGGAPRARRQQQEGSELFRYFVERNRLLMLAKCAPERVAVRAALIEARSARAQRRRRVPAAAGPRPAAPPERGAAEGAVAAQCREAPAGDDRRPAPAAAHPHGGRRRDRGVDGRASEDRRLRPVLVDARRRRAVRRRDRRRPARRARRGAARARSRSTSSAFRERLGIDLAGLAFHAMDFVVECRPHQRRLRPVDQLHLPEPRRQPGHPRPVRGALPRRGPGAATAPEGRRTRRARRVGSPPSCCAAASTSPPYGAARDEPMAAA